MTRLEKVNWLDGTTETIPMKIDNNTFNHENDKYYNVATRVCGNKLCNVLVVFAANQWWECTIEEILEIVEH